MPVRCPSPSASSRRAGRQGSHGPRRPGCLLTLGANSSHETSIRGNGDGHGSAPERSRRAGRREHHHPFSALGDRPTARRSPTSRSAMRAAFVMAVRTSGSVPEPTRAGGPSPPSRRSTTKRTARARPPATGRGGGTRRPRPPCCRPPRCATRLGAPASDPPRLGRGRCSARRPPARPQGRRARRGRAPAWRRRPSGGPIVGPGRFLLPRPSAGGRLGAGRRPAIAWNHVSAAPGGASGTGGGERAPLA